MVSYVPPATLSFIRWGITHLVVLPFAFAEVMRERKSIQAHWRILLLLGLMSTSLQNTIFYWGIYYSSATNAALLNSTIPIWILVISSIFWPAFLPWRVGGRVCVVDRRALYRARRLAVGSWRIHRQSR